MDSKLPLTLEERLAAMPSEVVALADSLRESPSNVGKRLTAIVRDFFRGQPLDPLFSSLLGSSTGAYLESCLDKVRQDDDLREDLANQIGGMLRFLLGRLEGGHAVPVEVVTGSAGQLQLKLEGRTIPIQRLPQFYDWRNVPTCAEPLEGRLLELEQAVYIRDSISKCLHALRTIAASNAYRTLGPELDLATWLRRGDGHNLEIFIRDCLSRSGLACRAAPLHEDILEAIDLRVTIPGVQRPRGVRIQVSGLRDFEAFRRKRFLIPYATTVVLLCPFTLAQSWRWEHDADIPTGYADSSQRLADEANAAEIAKELLDCVGAKPIPPLGPSETAPKDLVDLIARYVRLEGTRANARLRERQVENPSFGASAERVRDYMIEELRTEGLN